MSAENEQGFTLAQIFEENETNTQEPINEEKQETETETKQEPKAEAETQQKPIDTQGKSAYQLFRERISQYPTKQEARKHYKEIAAELGVHVALGYKAEKKVKQWRTQKQSAKVPTFKIEQAEIDEAPTEETPIYTPYEEPTQTQQQPITQSQIEYSSAPFMTDVNEKLNEVIQHQAPKCLNHVFEILGSRTGLSEGSEQFLDKQDSADLAVLLPIVVKKVTGSQMNAETTENVALGVFTAQLTLKGIKNKLKGKPIKPEPKPEPQQTPQPTPKQETKPEAPQEQKPENPTNVFNDNRPKWEKLLK